MYNAMRYDFQFPSFVCIAIVLGMEPIPHLSVYVEFLSDFSFCGLRN